MDDLLHKYFKLRMNRVQPYLPNQEDFGPIVTISRDYGCPGKKIAEELANNLSTNYKDSWTWIDKEILEQLSKELKLNPSVVNDLSNFTDRKLSDYIALIFSTDYYPGEKKIKNTMAEIITSFANKGNVVIVGRAGFILTSHIKKSFHIKLTAPFEWRVDQISEKRGISYPDAIIIVEEFKIKREQFLKFYSSSTNDDLNFHAFYDCSLMTDEQIISDTINKINEIGIFN